MTGDTYSKENRTEEEMVERRTWVFLLAGLLIVVVVTTVVVGIYVGRGAGRGERVERVEVPENLPKNTTESTDGHGVKKRTGRMNPWEINQSEYRHTIDTISNSICFESMK